MKYNTTLSSSGAVERLLSVGAAILTVKRASLTSIHFRRLVFSEGKVRLFEVMARCRTKRLW